MDNGGSMGVFANVDPETGLVITDGYDEHNVCYQTHPDSGVQFKGFQLPEWNNLLNIITECANKLTTLKSVSWDMAYAASKEYPEFAWTIVETNPMGDFLNQIAGKKGFKKEMEEYIRQTDTSIRL